MYRIPENLREENSSQFPIKKVAIWSLFLAILGGTSGGTPGKEENLGKWRFRVSCAQKIREIYEKTRGNQSLEFLGPSKNHQKTRENTRKSESLEFISSGGTIPERKRGNLYRVYTHIEIKVSGGTIPERRALKSL